MPSLRRKLKKKLKKATRKLSQPVEKLKKPLKTIAKKIQNAQNKLKEADGEDDNAKRIIQRYKRMLDSTNRLHAVKELLYRGEYDVNWRSNEFPNHSALHQASKFGHGDIIQVLLRSGWNVNKLNEYRQTP